MSAEAWHSPVLSPQEQVLLLLLLVTVGKSWSPSQLSSPSPITLGPAAGCDKEMARHKAPHADLTYSWCSEGLRPSACTQ